MPTNNQNNKTKHSTDKRGFASMPHEKVQEIARKGGEASHKNAGTGQGNNKRDNTKSSSK